MDRIQAIKSLADKLSKVFEDVKEVFRTDVNMPAIFKLKKLIKQQVETFLQEHSEELRTLNIEIWYHYVEGNEKYFPYFILEFKEIEDKYEYGVNYGDALYRIFVNCYADDFDDEIEDDEHYANHISISSVEFDLDPSN